MTTALKLAPRAAADIPLQQASADIWEKKYRLVAKNGNAIDGTIDETYKRIASALADVEESDVREFWFGQFVSTEPDSGSSRTSRCASMPGV